MVFQNFDHEGYKTAIRNFLTADPPDLAELVRRQPHGALRRAGQFRTSRTSGRRTASTSRWRRRCASMTIDGKQWGVPYTYYQWGIYYSKDVYEAAGVEAAEDLGRIRRHLREASRKPASTA